MNDLTTKNDAAISLEQIKQAQDTVKRKSLKEYLPWFGWGLYALITYPPFDFIKSNVWGPIAVVLFIFGMLLSYRYYKVSNERVHAVSYMPRFVAYVTGVTIFAAIFIINISKTHYHYAWTIGGVALAALFITYGFYLKLKA